MDVFCNVLGDSENWGVGQGQKSKWLNKLEHIQHVKYNMAVKK